MPNEPDSKLVEAIGFFEKMLQTMPGDRTSLEFLAVAYEQTGDVDKQVSILAKLSESLLKEGDLEHAAVIADKLKSFRGNPQAMAAAKVAEMIISKGQISSSQRAGSNNNSLFFENDDETSATAIQLDVQQGSVQSWASDAAKAEIEIVWQWKDNGILPKEVCMDLLHVFMDHPFTDIPILVSALGLLEEQRPEYTDAALEDMQKKSNLPAIPLELFEVSLEVASVLPIEYMKVKGVIPFATISDELLVGIMNPLNESLQTEIEKLSGKVCHFFLVHPSAWVSVTSALFH